MSSQKRNTRRKRREPARPEISSLADGTPPPVINQAQLDLAKFFEQLAKHQEKLERARRRRELLVSLLVLPVYLLVLPVCLLWEYIVAPLWDHVLDLIRISPRGEEWLYRVSRPAEQKAAERERRAEERLRRRLGLSVEESGERGALDDRYWNPD